MTTIPLSPADLDAITTVVDEDDDVDPQTYLQGCLTAALNAWMVDPDDDRPEGEVIASGASARIRPSNPMMPRFGRSSSRHHVTSVMSPKVQIIAMPVPLSGWAR